MSWIMFELSTSQMWFETITAMPACSVVVAVVVVEVLVIVAAANVN
jgi:hypothetical protein